MKKIAISVVIVGATTLATTGDAKAQTLPSPFTIDNKLAVVEELKPKIKPPQLKKQKHTVVSGDNLTKIAKQYNTTVDRLWRKNKQIKHPDRLIVGRQITIPERSEKLKERKYPTQAQTAVRQAQNGPGLKPAITAPASIGGLSGSVGSVSPYGNCVNEPGVNSPNNGTNPIAWPITSTTPSIGATALWTYNHTGVVTGIYDGGQYIEVRHQNYRGGQTKFHISEFRGFR